MTITREPDGTRRSQFDQAGPNTLADLFRKMALGSYLQGQAVQVRRQVGTGAAGSNQLAASPYNNATALVLALPDGGKASQVLRATVRTNAGGVAAGEYTPDAYANATPATLHVGVGPNGNITTLGTDLIADMDLIYIPERGDVIETVLPVIAASGICALPAWLTAKGIVLLLEAEVTVGGALAEKRILIPLTAAPAAGFVQLDLPKANVRFAAADAVTEARIKVLVAPAEALADVLEHVSDTV
jgi:hypothetical protein